MPSVSVVIPTYNEAQNLPHVFARLPVEVDEVIVVDGHSTDGTPAVARQLRPDVRVVTQTRKGKGNALACGSAAATGDIIALIDADGSTDPREIPQFVDALLNGADFAKGTRFAAGGGSSDITPLRSAGNKVLCGIFNLLYGTRYSDLCYGFNAFWRQHLRAFGFEGADSDGTAAQPGSDGTAAETAPRWGDGFEIEALMSIRASTAELAVAEVASFEHSRIHGTSNLSTFRDGYRVLRTILTERRRSRRAVADVPADRPELAGQSAA